MQDVDQPHIIELNEKVIDLGSEIFANDSLAPLRPPIKVPPLITKPDETEVVLQKPKLKKRIPIPIELLKSKASDSVAVQKVFNRNFKLQAPKPDGVKKLTESEFINKSNVPHSVSNSTVATVTKPPYSRYTRNKPLLRTKVQNSRLVGVDPRFRRTRSPSSRNRSLVTQSESRVSPPNSERKKNKSQSDSKFLISSQSDAISTARMHIVENQGDLVVSAKKLLSQNSGGTDTKESEKSDEPSSKIDQDKSLEDATITESTTLAPGTLYHSAVCEDTSIKKDKPYWDDPRLIDKYGKFLKPVSIAPRHSISSWTLPLETPDQHLDFTSGDCERCALSKDNSRRQVLKHTCSKCVNPTDNETIYTDRSIKTISDYEPNKDNLYNLVYTNYVLAIFFTIGSICGLLLVALIIWILANDLTWTYLHKDTPKNNGICSQAAYFFGGIIYGIINICKMIGFIFVIPRKEVYDSNTKIETTEPWYSSLISWT